MCETYRSAQLHQADGPLDLARPHFVGIGGVGTSALAHLLADRGCQVSGSDLNATPATEALARRGVRVAEGHDAAHVDGATLVVVGSAIRPDNPELAAALQQGVPVAHRAQLLGHLMGGRRSVAVAGTHGKSSTAGMLCTALQVLGQDPSWAIGADLDTPGSGARTGSGGIMVAEVDESDRSLTMIRPDVALVTSIDYDHPENYTDLDEVVEAFTGFAAGIPVGGTLVVNTDDDHGLAEKVRAARPDLHVVTYGHNPDADWRITSTRGLGNTGTATVATPTGQTVAVVISIPGGHQARNAVGALATLANLGIDVFEAASALASFGGLRRRFEQRGALAGVTVVESFAHHPTAIAADIATARSITRGRVVVCVEPSGRLRAQALAPEFARALAEADHVVTMGLHDTAAPGPADGAEQAAHRLAEAARPGDLVLVMGVGAAHRVPELLLGELQARTPTA